MAAEDQSKEMSMVERCMIRPSAPTPRQHLFLSSLDLLWLPYHYNRKLLFYATPGGYSSQDTFISTLKASLALVLVPFYPAAGRLALMTHSTPKRVCIDCNDAGVEFLVAATAHSWPHFDQLRAQNFQPCPFFNKLAPYDVHSSSEIFNLPLLSIQVTKLGFEGLALGFAHSHVLADGNSIWHLMNSWAECARKEPMSMLPFHMRTVLAVEKPSEKRAFLHYPPEGLSISECATGPPVVSKEPLKENYFQCSGKMIQRLKDEANGIVASYSNAKHGNGADIDRFVNGNNSMECTHDSGKNDKYCKEEDQENMYSFTSYEALCAHWWKQVTWARGLEGNQVVRFEVLADMRSRLSPKLPPSYFGNAILAGFTYASAAEILQESLAQTAARIHQASLASSEDYLWSFLHWLELHDHTLEPKFYSNAPSLITVSSPRFRVYDVDYGYGRPMAVRTSRTKGDGEMVLFPLVDGHKGGVDICIALFIPAMDNLLKDSSLCLS